MVGLVSLFIFLLTLFAVFHQIALTFSLYWYYWWFDILMHFWGGVLLGLLYYLAVCSRWFNFKQTTLTIVLFLLAVTVGWEVYEYLIRYTDSTNYALDTTTDIILGLSGGLLVHFLTKAYKMK